MPIKKTPPSTLVRPQDPHSRINRRMAEILLIDDTEITPNAHIIDDLGGDSLDAVEITMALEEEFEIEIPEEDATDLEDEPTVQKIYDYIDKRLAK